MTEVVSGLPVTSTDAVLAGDPAQLQQLDPSARAGLLLAAFAVGASTQPNLLTRGTPDQALITGLSGAVSYGWGVSFHSFLRSTADRLPGNPIVAGLAVDAGVAAAGLGAAVALRPRPKESGRRAFARLLAISGGAAAAAGVGADVLESLRGRRSGSVAMLAAMAGVGGAAWLRTKGNRSSVGSLLSDGTFFEDTPRSISPAKATGLGVAMGGMLFGLSHVESSLSTGFSRLAATALGGAAEDHRALGRIGATATSYGLGWLALAAVTAKLTGAGSEVEQANIEQPQLPEVTGSPASEISWDVQSREGTRWLGAVLRPGEITAVMAEPAKQPIRVYASLAAADTVEARAELLLRELDRTRAFERSAIALFSPTGSGYVNYVACESFEFLTRGDCASMAIEYSVLPSALSLTRAALGTRQTRLVIDGIVERLLALPADKRPKFFLFGESLGSKVSEELFTGASDAGPRGIGLDAAVWVGTPAFTQWRKQLWGDRPQGVPPRVGPGAVFVPRAIQDWHTLPADQRQRVRYLLLQNGDDPIPKFEAPLLWRQPDWLGPDHERPIGAPRGTSWMPVTTFVATFTDLMNALTPTPGRFQEGGHDYRAEIPDAIRTVWQLSADADQMQRMLDTLARRELAWEVKRDWDSAQAKSGQDRDKAVAKVRSQVAAWIGSPDPLTDEQIAELQHVLVAPEPGPANIAPGGS